MCQVCGCETSNSVLLDGVPLEPGASASPYRPAQGQSLLHFGLGPAHAHAPGLSQEKMIRIERDILDKNNTYARTNRHWLEQRQIFCINLMSSPGSGKTTLLVNTLQRIQSQVKAAVVEGDQQTSQDAERIRATGVPAVQINTGKGCHLDAHMVGQSLQQLALQPGSLLFIENVGNLVCPAGFDLGEQRKVVILSVTEGEDKPLKYPDMFHAADLLLLNKVDLLPYVSFQVSRCVEMARRVNPSLPILELSATRGDGMQAWVDWLLSGLQALRAAPEARSSGVPAA